MWLSTNDPIAWRALLASMLVTFVVVGWWVGRGRRKK